MSLQITSEPSFSHHFLILMVQLEKAKTLEDKSTEVFLSILICQKHLKRSFPPTAHKEFSEALSIANIKTTKFLRQFFPKEPTSTILKLCVFAAKNPYLLFGRSISHTGLNCLNLEYPCAFEFGGFKYPSALHAFIAQTLSKNSNLQQKCATSTQKELFQLAIESGNSDHTWYEHREETLFHIFCAKFGQNTELQQNLCATLDTPLIFTEPPSKRDSVWGIGSHGKGSNKMGQALMKVRKYYGGIGETPLAQEHLQQLSKISYPEALDKSDTTIEKEHSALEIRQKSNEAETSICQKTENKDKNQGHYKHCIYDKTLVPLSTHRYINANFMLSGSIIATQSPMSNTEEDFWLMVLEQKCKSIVMLNDPSDVTHHVYYHSSKCFDTIQVQLVHGPTFKTDPSWSQSPYEEEPHGLKIRILTIKKGDETHTLTHYQYMNWKDNKLGSEGCVGKLVTAVYAHQGDDRSPIVVHCLSGIGRTGAFATIYDQYCKWKKSEPIDVFQCVEQQRSPETGRYCNMIPLATQYLFCYHTLQFLCKT